MNKLTVIINDFCGNFKSFITYDLPDIAAIRNRLNVRDEHLVKLQSLPEFRGYFRWCDLTVNHYRFLIARALTVLETLGEDRINSKHPDVKMTNFIIAAFIIKLENLNCGEIEHFRISRFDDNAVMFDYSCSLDMSYDKPEGRAHLTAAPVESPFSIVVDNTHDKTEG